MTSGFIQPPISAEAVRHMDDEDWVRAMSRHEGPRLLDIEHPLRWGAEELAHLFLAQFKEDPGRFVSLATRLPDGLHSSYHQARCSAALRSPIGCRRMPFGRSAAAIVTDPSRSSRRTSPRSSSGLQLPDCLMTSWTS